MGIQINGQTDTITAIDGALTVSGAELPTVTNLNATGIVTAGQIFASSAVITGNVSVAGTVTYEDTTNVDSIGVVTARSGIVIGSGTSINSPSSNVLAFGTNNNERVRVSAVGVSIGTVTTYGDSNASFTSLSLGGNGTRYGLLEIKQSNGVAGSWIDCYGTNGNGDLRITTAGTSNNITFWTGGAFTEKVRITSDGNLGIGITNPNSKLDVFAGDGISITNSGDTFLQCRTTGTTAINYIEFKDSGGAAGAIAYNHTENSLWFKVNGTEKLRITSDGELRQSNNEQYTRMFSGSQSSPSNNTWYNVTDFAFQYNLVAFLMFLSFENSEGDGNNTTALFMSPANTAYASGATTPIKIAGASTLEAQITTSSPYNLQVRTTANSSGNNQSKLRWWAIAIPGN